MTEVGTVIAAETGELHLALILPRDADDWHEFGHGVGLEATADTDPVFAREKDIKDHQIRESAEDHVQGGLAIVRFQCCVTARQSVLENCPDKLVVIDNQDFVRFHLLSLHWQAGACNVAGYSAAVASRS